MHLMDFLFIFGLVSERFGDGDTSHVGLDIEEVIFLCLRLNVFACWVGRYGFTVFLIFSDSTYIWLYCQTGNSYVPHTWVCHSASKHELFSMFYIIQLFMVLDKSDSLAHFIVLRHL